MQTDIETKESETQEKRNKRQAMSLIALCWLVYTCSYVGKVNYSANIVRIQGFYNIENYTEMGLVNTLFFFAYGAGQIFNGIWCKKYNVKWVIFTSLMVSGSINLAITFMPEFAPVKYLWVINGFSLSMLWPTLIRFLSESLPKKYMAKASVVMGTTIAIGTFFVYATSAIYARFTTFKLSFYTAAVVMMSVALVWVFSVSRLGASAKEGSEITHGNEEQDLSRVQSKNVMPRKVVYLSICMLAFFGIMTNLIKDGLGTWVPSILKENYKLDESLSIILALALPMVAVFGNALAVAIHKKLKDFIYHCGLMFAISGLFIILVIVSLGLDSWILPLACFTVVTLMVSSCNSIITGIFPLFMRERVNSGLVAGVLNGFCYLGSALSTYVLAAIVDSSGWKAVFITLFVACVAVVVGNIVYFTVRKFVFRVGASQTQDDAD